VEITESNINETLTLPKDGEVRFGGSLMVWKDNRLYRKNEDGSLTLVDSSLDTMTDEHGQRWLTQDNEGHVLIQVSLRVWATINFEYNSAEILESSEGILTAFGHALNTPALRDCGLIIAGHTDGRGSESYNMELSRRRASSVAEWLTERMGIAPERLILTAYGLSHPVADNSTAEGRAKNRRVEFILLPANGDSRP
jgi:outer membrane protein OmpA-like peptidoglycan-associated protein